MYINHVGMNRGRGRRRWWFKAKGPRKISTIAPYSKNACT
jgi:ribosomal protein L22